MNTDSLDILIIGLSLSSSWGNGHATTYRSLVKGLHQEGHRVVFLERDIPWYAANRDLTTTTHCRLCFYGDLEELRHKYTGLVRKADLVIAGSYLKEGVPIGHWITSQAGGVTAFYDIDTPVTLDKLKKQDYEYISPELIPEFDLYLSFSGGKILDRLKEVYKAPSPRPLYCSVDPDLYHPESQALQWQLGYLGTYSSDRQPALNRLFMDVAKEQPDNSFVVAGPQYPPEIDWPDNIERIEHLPPGQHREFYNRQHFTLNITRKAMIKAGFSPSVRLFEAAACATPVISDYWDGIETLFDPGREILIADSTEDVLRFLREIPAEEKSKIGLAARERILKKHSSQKRARQLVQYIHELGHVAV